MVLVYLYLLHVITSEYMLYSNLLIVNDFGSSKRDNSSNSIVANISANEFYTTINDKVVLNSTT
jgi:hypothetical protein